ncbi:secreted RxLR effector peptide protein, putative [Phytophthora infestans T30-4]|uniref:RxLR effector protein n=2 Tax=Phytophthora infestans TaxID=4787 RepID=D0NJY2_PHYIT|nr:secreted RxLR effector peptide protein, putative [Phytophthora infestans T30-4]EEY59819.1 secreted RxLR effector peptide protein, putative [Phytophthora infestans T30-4]KAF4130560.1 hypothetical protein GN958_ATG20262 [Phytophthora infestans]KAF4135840.1 hypothetical protein GN958_ATG14973 [Phytophthora infestans]|eukprot:XP_002900504.1 secreted RxLR effector peptide protein, putative [Phytophthora infestans T30-4]
MRFYIAFLATAATILVSTNAATVDAQHNWVSKTTPELVTTTHIDVKRSLRSHQHEDESNDDSASPQVDKEERENGIMWNKLMKDIKDPNKFIKADLTLLSAKQLKHIKSVLEKQDRTQKQVSKKLGNQNSKFVEEWKESFRVRKKPKPQW